MIAGTGQLPVSQSRSAALEVGFGALAALVHDADVVVEEGGDDGDDVGFDNAGADGLGAADADVDYALEGEVPFPNLHQVVGLAIFQDGDEALDAAVDG